MLYSWTGHTEPVLLTRIINNGIEMCSAAVCLIGLMQRVCVGKRKFFLLMRQSFISTIVSFVLLTLTEELLSLLQLSARLALSQRCRQQK